MKRLLPLFMMALLAAPGVSAQDRPSPDAPPPGQAGPGNADDGSPERRRGRPGEADGEQRGERPDRGGRGEWDRGRDGSRWRLSPEQLDEAIAIVEQVNPELAESLREARRDSVEAAIRQIAEEFPNIYELMRMHDEEPERFALHVQSLQVMRESGPIFRQLRQAQEDEDHEQIDALTEQLRTSIATMFDIRMQLRQLEIEELRQRITELEEQLADDGARRDEAIAERLEMILTGRFGRGGPRGEGRGGERRGPRGEGGGQGRPEAPGGE